MDNSKFRHVLYTGKHLQLVMMSIAPGEDIGEDVHEDGDQFFRIERTSEAYARSSYLFSLLFPQKEGAITLRRTWSSEVCASSSARVACARWISSPVRQ